MKELTSGAVLPNPPIYCVGPGRIETSAPEKSGSKEKQKHG